MCAVYKSMKELCAAQSYLSMTLCHTIETSTQLFVLHYKYLKVKVCPEVKISQHSCVPCSKDISKQLCALQ